MRGVKGFKPGNYEERKNNFDPLPAGNYSVMITGAEVAETRKKKEGESDRGEMLKLTCEVQGEKFAGRLLWHIIIIQHDNSDVEKRGLDELAELGRCLGLEVIEDENDLVGGELGVKVTQKEETYKGETQMRNRIVKWLSEEQVPF